MKSVQNEKPSFTVNNTKFVLCQCNDIRSLEPDLLMRFRITMRMHTRYIVCVLLWTYICGTKYYWSILEKNGTYCGHFSKTKLGTWTYDSRSKSYWEMNTEAPGSRQTLWNVENSVNPCPLFQCPWLLTHSWAACFMENETPWDSMAQRRRSRKAPDDCHNLAFTQRKSFHRNG